MRDEDAKDLLYLEHIISCIDKIARWAGDGQDNFINDEKTQEAIIRKLQILSESTQRLSSRVKLAMPDIKWKDISGFRNMVVHEYLGIDVEIIWQVIEQELPHLKDACIFLVKQIEDKKLH